MKYLMDANTYIEAKNKYYGMDFCPGYWDWLIDQFAMGNVASIDFVGKELEKGNDKLREWCRSHRDHFIESNDLDTQAEYYEVVNFVMAGKYNPGNRDGFLKGADPWLIAKSKSTGAVLVTHEARKAPADTTKVKIPNICDALGVQCISTFELLRTLEARFKNEN